jgi:hypothetical protein
MDTSLIIHTKEVKEDEIVEIKAWKVPKTRSKPHGVKISIVYIKNGKRLVGYDNAEGKGYHRHIMNSEEEYTFTDIWQLIEDFKNDVSRIRGRKWDED